MLIVEITPPEECRKGRKWQKLAHIFIPHGPFEGCASDAQATQSKVTMFLLYFVLVRSVS
jgi:hypothetical protein